MSTGGLRPALSNGPELSLPAGDSPIKAPSGRSILERRRPCAAWRLSGRAQPDAPIQEVPVATQPFTIGRRSENTLSVANTTISGRHAELISLENRLYIKDLNSTNGTFLNGRRIVGVEPLHDGDRLQLGTAIFMVQQQREATMGATVAANVADDALAYAQFERLLNDPAVDPHYQPVVRIDGSQCLGYEVLARSKLVGLETPDKMFRMATELDCDAELSIVLRREGLRRGRDFGPQTPLYLNTHPSEVGTSQLIASLAELRAEFPEQIIMLEIHEAAVTGPGVLVQLRAELKRLQMGLAYDDFGAGQARLLELADVPPDVIKFDMHLIRNLHTASADKLQMVASLVEMVRRLGAIPLAEGVESAEEAAICQQVGFELAQGFFFGYPAPAETWRKPRPPADF